MFDFLNFFSKGASIFATVASIFNTYDSYGRIRKKLSKALYEQRHYLCEQQEQQKFDRQQLGYNIQKKRHRNNEYRFSWLVT